jgi:hypothetical protein
MAFWATIVTFVKSLFGKSAGAQIGSRNVSQTASSTGSNSPVFISRGKMEVVAPFNSQPAETPIEKRLSAEAKTLLAAAAKDEIGMILCINQSGCGVNIQTNGLNLIPNQEPRVVAIWKGALRELQRASLLESEGSKEECFRLSRLGYEVADRIKSEN